MNVLQVNTESTGEIRKLQKKNSSYALSSHVSQNQKRVVPSSLYVGALSTAEMGGLLARLGTKGAPATETGTGNGLLNRGRHVTAA